MLLTAFIMPIDADHGTPRRATPLGFVVCVFFRVPVGLFACITRRNRFDAKGVSAIAAGAGGSSGPRVAGITWKNNHAARMRKIVCCQRSSLVMSPAPGGDIIDAAWAPSNASPLISFVINRIVVQPFSGARWLIGNLTIFLTQGAAREAPCLIQPSKRVLFRDIGISRAKRLARSSNAQRSARCLFHCCRPWRHAPGWRDHRYATAGFGDNRRSVRRDHDGRTIRCCDHGVGSLTGDG